MSLTYAVLLILLILYVPIWIWVWRKPEDAARWHLQKYGPCIMIRTRLGMRTMDRLAGYPRFWHAFGFMSKVISAVLLFLMLYMLAIAILAVPSQLASGTSVGVEYVLAIPGFNPIMPLSYGVVALFFAMVVHELGHGIQARVNGISVKSSGLLYGVVPLGAFVEPDEKEMAEKPRKAQIDVYAAGITVNTVCAVAAILLMVGACGTVTSDYGDSAGVYYVYSDSPAYHSGIPASALIVGVSDSDGELIVGEDVDGNSSGELKTIASGGMAYPDFSFDPTQLYVLTYLYEGTAYETEPMQMGLYVTSVVSGSPADKAGMEPGLFISAVETGDETISIGGYRDFNTLLRSLSEGTSATITAVDTEFVTHEYDVTFGTNGEYAYLGVGLTTSGFSFVTPDLMLDRAINPLYGAENPYDCVTSLLSYLSGPFNGMDPISDDVKWWYGAGDAAWIFITLMYWIFWLDILLAITNALPTFVLDGGFIFAGGVNWALEKFRIAEDRRRALTESIAGNVSSVVLFLFVLVIVAMIVRGGE